MVLGDSTGVGVGASKSDQSIAGLLSKGMHATYTENLAVSGAVVADLSNQIMRAQLAHYDTILVQIGGNDIVGFHKVQRVSMQLCNTLASLATKGTKILLMSAGNVGSASIFPRLLRPFYTALTLDYHASFEAIARLNGATYINLYSPASQDPFLKEPSVYLAADGFHPSSAGYLLWYAPLKETLLKIESK